MRSILSTVALATTISSVQAAPAIPGIADLPAIVGLPTDPGAITAWYAARGVYFDPNYVHIPTPGEVFNPRPVIAGLASLTANLTSLPMNRGTIPSVSTNPISARLVGADDRYQYSNPNAFPWRSVGRILRSDGGACTGQLIGARHVLTAKHCLPLGKDNVSMTFSPSYDRGPNPTFGTANVITYVYNGTTAWNVECEAKHDHAILILDKRMGDGLGWFGAEVANNRFFNQKIFTTMGYPGDRDGGQRPYRMDGSQLPNPWKTPQFACDGKTGQLFSDTDSFSGQSGSALWKDGGIVWGVLRGRVNYSDGAQAVAWGSGDDLLNMIWWSVENFK